MSKTSSASKIKMKSFEDLFGTNEVVGAKNISGEIRDIPLNSLDSTSGIGLIEKIRRGLGKPDIIYVKNFVGVVAEQARETSDEFAEVPKSNFKKSQNQICRSSKIELQEVPEKDFKKSQDKTSRSSNMTPQEVSLWDSNYTYKSNTYENYTNLINPSDDSNRALSCKADVMDEMENIRVYIKSNIDYDELVERHRTSKASIDEIVELVVETIAMKTETIALLCRLRRQDVCPPYQQRQAYFSIYLFPIQQSPSWKALHDTAPYQ